MRGDLLERAGRHDEAAASFRRGAGLTRNADERRLLLGQRRELEAAREPAYTFSSLVDFPGARYELLDGETEIAPGVHIVPTPGHVDGHQSVVLQCDDGTVILAGQAHDSASEWSVDALAAQAPGLGHEPPLPLSSAWMSRLLAFDPKRVYFAHDSAVWMP